MKRSVSGPELRDQLLEILRLLAAPAADQDKWLQEHHFPVDELALTLNDAVPSWLDRLQNEQLLDSDARQRIVKLDKALSEFSGHQHSELWTSDALYTTPEWEETRKLAKVAIQGVVGSQQQSS